jgi:NADPH-dependent curcumin reductase CurA
LGKALEGGCVGKVVESKNTVGDYVLGMKGWREYWISDGNPARNIGKIDPSTASKK